ncbi:hypothetical protein [Naasia sp. SYSU D00057]|uniref:hypothetical protein n=1 Tax=Naasia sp. SYSU D00057 TaxID=2817380 RepID=UPI001B311E22|nr:hypothetical protein [Naasia sp. SYSU D00057]
MTMPTADELSNVPLITAADIENRVAGLIGKAIIRKLWLLPLDAERKQIPLLMPIDGIPEKAPTDGSLGPFLKAVCAAPAREVVGVLERLGDPRLSADDRGWLRFLAAGLIEAGLGSAGMVLSHSTGCRWLPPEEWM